MNVKEEYSRFKTWLLEHKTDYSRILAEKPYCIDTSYDTVFGRNLVIFKYNQIESDFSQTFVKLSRGLILDADTFDIVSFPFVKFHNYGEKYADEIDWSSCYVTQKLDGSILKVVRFGDDVLISTNGTIDAFKAPIIPQIGCRACNFGELAVEAILNNKPFAFRSAHSHAVTPSSGNWIDHPDVKYAMRRFTDAIEEGKTYIFELTSPYNKIVVPFSETRLNFIGIRDNETCEESFFGGHPFSKMFNTPKVFPLRNIDECVEAANTLKSDEEGYVVVDGGFNRVKVKSPLYVSIHHLRGEGGVMSYKRALEIIKKNEVDEVLTYFPEYEAPFKILEEKFAAKVSELETVWNQFTEVKNTLTTRKDQAIWITKHTKTPGFIFAMLDGKIPSVRDGIFAAPNETILKMFGLKDNC